MNTRRALRNAIDPIYAEADLRLERAQMDLLHPEDAPHTLADVKAHRQAERTRQAAEAANSAARDLGRYLGGLHKAIATAMQTIAVGFREAAGTTRTDYTLGGPR